MNMERKGSLSIHFDDGSSETHTSLPGLRNEWDVKIFMPTEREFASFEAFHICLWLLIKLLITCSAWFQVLIIYFHTGAFSFPSWVNMQEETSCTVTLFIYSFCIWHSIAFCLIIVNMHVATATLYFYLMACSDSSNWNLYKFCQEPNREERGAVSQCLLYSNC